jgi:L-glyceraldehyde 3-phosphate reductase
MWPGPYGDFGSKKYLVSSLDQSLKRMGLDYVDVFYHHRYDPDTPLEETMAALDLIVRQGKALYVGLSNYYDSAILKKALDILKDLGTPCILHQVRYSMFSREVEADVLQTAYENGSGTVCFSPLAQGLLTDKYLNGIPEDSRAAGASVFLKKENITQDVLDKVQKLNEIAKQRGQTLAQMALSWVVRDKRIASVIIGASKVSQIEGDIGILSASDFSKEELAEIDNILG